MRILLCLMLAFGLSGMVEAKEVKRNTSIPAKKLFSSVKTPSPMEPRVIGFYSKGCLAGAERFPANGPHWQSMHLERNRYWGHPELVAFIRKLAKDAYEKDGWPGLMVGDLSQSRGGPMIGDHKSHQNGIDVDVWLKPMPKKTLSDYERKSFDGVSMVKSRSEINPKTWTTKHAKLIRRAALDKKVTRIFINPAIKKEMCKWSKEQKDRTAWLGKLQPWYGHSAHMHVRLKCPEGSSGCKNQNVRPAAPFTGCDEGKGELAYWLSSKPYRHVPKPGEKVATPREIKLADLPKECTIVLNKQDEQDGKKVAAKINQANEKAPPTAGFID